MTDFNKLSEPPKKGPREILSPEGVEERVEKEFIFRVTLTGGGKYRVYMIQNGAVSSHGVYDTLKKAEEAMNRGMFVLGSLFLDPKATIEALFEKEGKKDKP